MLLYILAPFPDLVAQWASNSIALDDVAENSDARAHARSQHECTLAREHGQACDTGHLSRCTVIIGGVVFQNCGQVLGEVLNT